MQLLLTGWKFKLCVLYKEEKYITTEKSEDFKRVRSGRMSPSQKEHTLTLNRGGGGVGCGGNEDEKVLLLNTNNGPMRLGRKRLRSTVPQRYNVRFYYSIFV
jgi:hypothetical protein